MNSFVISSHQVTVLARKPEDENPTSSRSNSVQVNRPPTTKRTSISQPQKRRLSLPWRRSKNTSSASSPPITATTSSFEDAITQTSRLLTLPYEIQLSIYDYVFTPWTMAVLPHRTSATDEDESTLTLHFVSSRLISGPPATHLLLVCKQLYALVHPLYGSHCTGILHLGYIYGWSRHKLPSFLTEHCKLRRFYPQITTLSVSFALNGARIPLNFRDVFPNLKRAECRVDEGSYGPLLRRTDTYEEFLVGRRDEEFKTWTKPMVNYFLGVKGVTIQPVGDAACPWDDEDAVVDVKVIGTIGTLPGYRVGFHYRWSGSKVEVMSRVVRNVQNLKYWEYGMAPSSAATQVGRENVCPPRFRWVPVIVT